MAAFAAMLARVAAAGGGGGGLSGLLGAGARAGAGRAAAGGAAKAAGPAAAGGGGGGIGGILQQLVGQQGQQTNLLSQLIGGGGGKGGAGGFQPQQLAGAGQGPALKPPPPQFFNPNPPQAAPAPPPLNANRATMGPQPPAQTPQQRQSAAWNDTFSGVAEGAAMGQFRPPSPPPFRPSSANNTILGGSGAGQMTSDVKQIFSRNIKAIFRGPHAQLAEFGRTVARMPRLLLDWSDSLLASRRHLAQYSSSMAGAVAEQERRQIARGAEQGARTGPMARQMVTASEDFRDEIAPLQDAVGNIAMMLTTGGLRFATWATQILKWLTLIGPIAEAANKWLGGADEPDMAAFADFMKEMQRRHLDPAAGRVRRPPR